MSAREQSWSDEAPEAGRLVLVSDNPVSRAVAGIARIVGREVVMLSEDEDGAAVRAMSGLDPTEADAVVICDHDAPDAPRLLRDALDGRAGYVAMLASRNRSAQVLAELRADRYDEARLTRLHMPAGLDTGGKTPGEIALSVVAEVVATHYGRSGASMRERA